MPAYTPAEISAWLSGMCSEDYGCGVILHAPLYHAYCDHAFYHPNRYSIALGITISINIKYENTHAYWLENRPGRIHKIYLMLGGKADCQADLPGVGTSLDFATNTLTVYVCCVTTLRFRSA